MIARRGLAALAAMTVILGGLLAGTGYALTRPEQIRLRLAAAARRFVRGDVEVEGVRFRLAGGRGKVKRALLRPRGADGEPAGEVELRGVVLEHSPPALLCGRYRVLAASVDEVVCRVDDAARFIETFGALLEAAGATATADAEAEPPPPISIARLEVVHSGGPLPLTTTPTAGGSLVLERVRIRPERGPALAGAGARRFDVEASYRAGPFQRIDAHGVVDLGSGVLRLGIRASNLELRGRQLESISPAVARWFGELGPSGPVDVLTTITVPWRRPREATLAGELEAYDVTLAPRGFARPITNVSGRVGFGGASLTIDSLRGVYGRGEVRAHGRVEGARDGTGVDLELEGTHLDLADVAALPLPRPCLDAIDALGLEGDAGLHLAIATSPGEDLRRARFHGELALRDAAALGGAVSGLSARIWFAGAAAPPGDAPAVATATAAMHAAGSIRIDRATIGGAPVRDATAEVSLGAGELALMQAEGHLAGGLFRASAHVGISRPGAPALGLDLAARDVELAPVASALYGRRIEGAGTATGTLTVARAAGAAGAEVRVDAALAGLDLGGLPATASIAAALGTTRFERGRIGARVAADGGGSASFTLAAPAARASGAVAFDRAGTVSGTAEAGARRFALAGPLGEVVATPVSGAR